MPFATHMHIVSGNMCTKFQLNVLNGFWVMAIYLSFLHDTKDDGQGYHNSQTFFENEQAKNETTLINLKCLYNQMID